MQTVNQQIETELNQPVAEGGCPSCGAATTTVINLRDFHGTIDRLSSGLDQCLECGCLHGMAYRGDVGRFVNLNTLVEQGDADVRAFDITVLGSDGETRVHGFFRTDTKEVVQFG